MQKCVELFLCGKPFTFLMPFDPQSPALILLLSPFFA